jgi:hypothetical protein
MNIVTDGDTLSFLWSALADTPRESNHYHASRLAQRIGEKGLAFNSDVEDMLDWLEPRLNLHWFITIAFSKSIGIHWENVCYRPSAKSNHSSEFNAIRPSGMALLLIVLERLGFQTDPSLLADLLLPELKSIQKKILTDDEHEIFWLHKTRHKYDTITIRTSRELEHDEPAESTKTTTEYSLSLYLDEGGSAAQIEINSPKFLWRGEPILTTCKECGFQWYKGDPDSSQHHRKEHKKRMGYFDPQPSGKLLEERKTSSDPELVTYLSVDWKHREMYNRAPEFKYEFHFDFVQ